MRAAVEAPVTIVLWIASALGIAVLAVLALASLLAFAAVLSTLRVDGRVDGAGATGRVRWGIVDVAVDGTPRTVTVRLVRVRIVQRPLRRGTADAHDRDDGTDAGGRGAQRAARSARRGGRLDRGSYRLLARTALREIRAMARHVHVQRLMLDLTVASDDPALTGEAYGLGCAVLAWLRSVWPHAELRLSTDFTASRPYGAAEGAVSVRPVRLLPGVVRIALRVWMERRRSRRRASGARATVASRV